MDEKFHENRFIVPTMGYEFQAKPLRGQSQKLVTFIKVSLFQNWRVNETKPQ
jgi:hypothetical protein